MYFSGNAKWLKLKDDLFRLSAKIEIVCTFAHQFNQMSNQAVEVPLAKKPRLMFIDMARSIAILLMLEGHFIEIVFEGFRPMVDTFKANQTSGNVFFDIWYFIKGFTAPMFFTVTGIVFVFLLINEKKFFENPRVKKGIRRSIELILWGYLLQINFRSFDQYISGQFSSWVTAYHVLQSIGVGIAALLFIYWLHSTIRIGSLAFYYFIAGTSIFVLYPDFKAMPQGNYFPEGAPAIIQNVFKGPHSVFPVIPWMAFTLYGGMIGAIVKKHKENIKSYFFIFLFIGTGIVLNGLSYPICEFIDNAAKKLHISDNLSFVTNAWLYSRFGQILLVLGILIFIEKVVTIRENLFLKVGQNTLPIYIIHVIILYGGIFGYGLNNVLSAKLNGIESIIGAVIFIGTFVLLIRYWDHVENWWSSVKIKLSGKAKVKAKS